MRATQVKHSWQREEQVQRHWAGKEHGLFGEAKVSLCFQTTDSEREQQGRGGGGAGRGAAVRLAKPTIYTGFDLRSLAMVNTGDLSALGIPCTHPLPRMPGARK